MTEQEALRKLISPGQKRHGKRAPGGVLQIWVTRACDRDCFGCTQGANLRANTGQITPTQFEIACYSLRDYFGIVGLLGGNPALHPQFEELCQILAKYIPKHRCGLWCNNLIGKGAAARKAFSPAHSNLNVHLEPKAYAEIRRTWPEARPFGLHGESRHSPPFVALQDLVPTEQERWDYIVDCDINKYWSAMICVFRDELRGYFCEIAAAQAMLHQHEPDYPDLGLLIEDGWWRKPMSDFAAQARYHCHACGVPLRGYGELACSEDEQSREQVTKTHVDIYRPKDRDRRVQLVTRLDQLDRNGHPKLHKITDYLGNAKR